MAKITILDQWSDGCGANVELTVAIPEALQSMLGGAIEQTIRTGVRYSSTSLSDDAKVKEITTAYKQLADDHVSGLRSKLKFYGTEIEVK